MRVPALAAALALSLGALYATTTTTSEAAQADYQPQDRASRPVRPATVDGLPGLDGDGTGRIKGLGARSAFVYDVDAGLVLLERRADDPYPVASLTKLVAGLALMSTEPDLDATLCVDEQFRPSRSGARSRLDTGDCYRGWDLVGAALVASDNRAAYGLQVLSGLDHDAFVGRMDDVAADLGMVNSSFAEPSGLEDDNLSTARDIVKAVIAVAGEPSLQIAASAPHWKIARASGVRRGPAKRALPSTDKLLQNRAVEVIAAKTGFSNTAGYCFTAVVRTATGRTLAFSLLGERRDRDRWADVRRVLAAYP